MREPFQGGWNKCPVCGKQFRVDQPASWKYVKNKRRGHNKYKRIYFCSWKCVREFEKRGLKKDGSEKGT